MQITGWKKLVFGLLATIFLGALGSGLWDIALKPGGSWFWHALLTALTFGSKTIKNQVYLDAAKGSHEVVAQSAARTVTWLLAGFDGALTGILLGTVLHRKPGRNAKDSAQGEAGARGVLNTGERYFLWVLLLFSFFVMVYVSIDNAKATAASQAYTYFRQSLDICRPYIGDHQAEMFESRFAALRTRDEYIVITDDLKRIANANHLVLPIFKPW